MAAGALESIPVEPNNQLAVRCMLPGQARTVNGRGPPPTTASAIASAARRPALSGGVAAADIAGGVEQSAAFFDPENEAAAELREKVALETLDELLDYVLEGGSVGILDATNSTLRRRKAVLDRIRQRAGSQIGVVFLESECTDPKLLEANMLLKLQGPDYKDSDPVQALADFKKRGEFAVAGTDRPAD